jgi:hypothetical protein
MHGFISERFTPPPGVAAQIVCDVSTPVAEPQSRVDPLLRGLSEMAVQQKTVAAWLEVTPTVVCRWTSGRDKLPPGRRASLAEMVRAAIKATQTAVKAAERLPQTPTRDAVLGIMRARLAIGAAVLKEEERRP